MLTRSDPSSVHSTGTTASAPDGSSAPVMIRTHVPGATSSFRVSPAGISSRTGSVTGCSRVAAATSAAITA
jgi:hypothetical protein